MRLGARLDRSSLVELEPQVQDTESCGLMSGEIVTALERCYDSKSAFRRESVEAADPS